MEDYLHEAEEEETTGSFESFLCTIGVAEWRVQPQNVTSKSLSMNDKGYTQQLPKK